MRSSGLKGVATAGHCSPSRPLTLSGWPEPWWACAHHFPPSPAAGSWSRCGTKLDHRTCSPAGTFQTPASGLGARVCGVLLQWPQETHTEAPWDAKPALPVSMPRSELLRTQGFLSWGPWASRGWEQCTLLGERALVPCCPPGWGWWDCGWRLQEASARCPLGAGAATPSWAPGRHRPGLVGLVKASFLCVPETTSWVIVAAPLWPPGQCQGRCVGRTPGSPVLSTALGGLTWTPCPESFWEESGCGQGSLLH